MIVGDSEAACLAARAAKPGVSRTAELPRIWGLFSNDALLPQLLLLAKMIERETSRQLQGQFKMSVAQWRVLAFVCISGPATAAYIGESAEVDQAEISRAVKALVQRGFVVREFEPGNRKKLIIAPTPAGQEEFRRIRKSRQVYFGTLTEGLAARDEALLKRSLHQIAEHVVAERDSRKESHAQPQRP